MIFFAQMEESNQNPKQILQNTCFTLFLAWILHCGSNLVCTWRSASDKVSDIHPKLAFAAVGVSAAGEY